MPNSPARQRAQAGAKKERMMKAQEKGTTFRLYLRKGDDERLVKLAEDTATPQTTLLTWIVSAGISAIESNGGRVVLPLRFTTKESRQ